MTNARSSISPPKGNTADAAVRVLTEPSTWGQRHDLTGPRQVSWPEALQVLSAELGETVTFRITRAIELIQRLTQAGRGDTGAGGTAGDPGMGHHGQGGGYPQPGSPSRLLSQEADVTG